MKPRLSKFYILALCAFQFELEFDMLLYVVYSNLLAVSQWVLAFLLMIKNLWKCFIPGSQMFFKLKSECQHLCVKTRKPQISLCSSRRVEPCWATPAANSIIWQRSLKDELRCIAQVIVFFVSNKATSITMQQHHRGKSCPFPFLKRKQNNKYLLDINNEYLNWIWQVAAHSHTNGHARTHDTHSKKIKLCLQGVWISSRPLHIQNVWMETWHQGPRRRRVVVSCLTTTSAVRGANQEIKLWDE